MASWDVEIDGAGYMIVPGSYRRRSVLPDRGNLPSGRQLIDDFRGGLAMTSVPGAWLAGDQMIGPGPRRKTASGTVGSASPKLVAHDASYLYVAAGSSFHRWPGSGSTQNRTSLPANAVDMVRKGSALFFAYDGNADVSRWVDGTATATNSVLGAGYKAHRLGAVGDLLVTCNNASRNQIDVWNASLTTSSTHTLHGDVRRMATYGDKLLVATDQGIYALTGIAYSSYGISRWGSVSDGLDSDSDYQWIQVLKGRLMTWVGGRIVQYDPITGLWFPTGPAGQATSGAAITNGWLLVTVTPHGGGDEELWGFDGDGWWLLDTDVVYPASVAGGLLAAFDGSTLHYYVMDSQDTPADLAASYQVVTDVLDAGRLERMKRWRLAGLELLRPDGETVGSWDFELAYSTDGGDSWSSLGSVTVADQRSTVTKPLAIESTLLQLSITATANSGLPPFIAAIWVEYISLDGSVRRRRWEFQVHARDNGIDRDGANDARTGQEVREAIWQLFDDASTMTFRDADYPDTLTEYTVSLTGIDEVWRNTADQLQLGADTLLGLTLVEV